MDCPLNIEGALALYADIAKIKGCTRAHRAIWQRLLVGQWYEALELARANSLEGAKTARGLTQLLLSAYRARKNGQARLKKIADHIELMTTEAEAGLDLRELFSPLADQWGLEPAPDEGRATRRQKKAREQSEKAVKREGKQTLKSSCAEHLPTALTRTREEPHTVPPAPIPAPRAERVIIAPASDPYYRHFALVELAQDIARELPPPSLPDHPIGQEYTGRATGDRRAEWISYIDQVARRWPGPLTPQDLSKISGAPVRWTNRLLEEWRALLERGITEDQRRSMALSMGAEAEAIAREALALVQSSDDERIKATGLKLALDSLARRQSLIGADKVALEARVEVTQGSWTEHAATAGLTGDELRQIGDIASRALSRKDEDKK
jgi:hypothetical protein